VLLRQWKAYLYENSEKDINFFNNNIFDYSSDLFSLPYLFDIYNFDSISNLELLNYQYYLNKNTNDTINYLVSYIKQSDMNTDLGINFLKLLNHDNTEFYNINNFFE
jgi:hypothetical protein